jgi:hypothetical protein
VGSYLPDEGRGSKQCRCREQHVSRTGVETLVALNR